MKFYLVRVTFASPSITSGRPHGNRGVLVGAGFLCFILVLNACNRNKTAQSDESGNPITHRSKSRTGEEFSPESVKDLFLSNQKHWEHLAKQQIQSISELSTSALVTSIRSLNLIGEGNDRIILPGLFLALAKKDPSKLFEMLNELPDEYYKIAMSEAFLYLAKENPEVLQSYVLKTDFLGVKD